MKTVFDSVLPDPPEPPGRPRFKNDRILLPCAGVGVVLAIALVMFVPLPIPLPYGAYGIDVLFIAAFAGNFGGLLVGYAILFRRRRTDPTISLASIIRGLLFILLSAVLAAATFMILAQQIKYEVAFVDSLRATARVPLIAVTGSTGCPHRIRDRFVIQDDNALQALAISLAQAVPHEAGHDHPASDRDGNLLEGRLRIRGGYQARDFIWYISHYDRYRADLILKPASEDGLRARLPNAATLLESALHPPEEVNPAHDEN